MKNSDRALRIAAAVQAIEHGIKEPDALDAISAERRTKSGRAAWSARLQAMAGIDPSAGLDDQALRALAAMRLGLRQDNTQTHWELQRLADALAGRLGAFERKTLHRKLGLVMQAIRRIDAKTA